MCVFRAYVPVIEKGSEGNVPYNFCQLKLDLSSGHVLERSSTYRNETPFAVFHSSTTANEPRSVLK